MQIAFEFLAPDIERWSARLPPFQADAIFSSRRRPVAQLVKSIISSRTRDAVSQAAFERLKRRFPTAACLTKARQNEIQEAIEDVTFASDKAGYVVETMRRLRTGPYGFDLMPLAELPLVDALEFLETLPGVARKVSASTLNASKLDIPVLIVDTHVLRVLQRLGAVADRADYRIASEAATAAMSHWSGADFLAFHVGMKRLGQTVCRPDHPDCVYCPLAVDCPSASGLRITRLANTPRRPSP